MPTLPPSEPEVLKIGVTQLWVGLGTCGSVIVGLVAFLCNLLLERVKKCETRLDEGSQAFMAIKLDCNSLNSEQHSLAHDIEDHSEGSVVYRFNTDKAIQGIEVKFGELKTEVVNLDKGLTKHIADTEKWRDSITRTVSDLATKLTSQIAKCIERRHS